MARSLAGHFPRRESENSAVPGRSMINDENRPAMWIAEPNEAKLSGRSAADQFAAGYPYLAHRTKDSQRNRNLLKISQNRQRFPLAAHRAPQWFMAKNRRAGGESFSPMARGPPNIDQVWGKMKRSNQPVTPSVEKSGPRRAHSVNEHPL